MDKLEYAIRQIANCDLCNGQGAQYWNNGDDYDFEDCVCNPYGLILDDGEVIFDNGLSTEADLFRTMEAL